MNEPTADEIMKMFAVDIAVLRRGRRKPSEKPPVGKKKTLIQYRLQGWVQPVY